MKLSLHIPTILVPCLLCAAAFAGPWFVDLEASMHDLPWVCSGNIITVDDSAITAVVTETFLGGALPGDTLEIPFWELGSWMGETLTEGEGFLLLPDTTGSLQLIGAPGRGYWLLRGYFEFNAFFVQPGVLDREELILLCSGDTLPARTVTMEVRFAGGSEFIDAVFKETDTGWLSDSRFPPLNGLELDLWDITLGGMDNFPFEPYVTLQLDAGEDMTLTLGGRVSSFEDGIYQCIVYPTGPVILDSESMAAFLERQLVPESPVIAIELSGAEYGELDLAENPYFTPDENGYLHLTGAGGLLDITCQFLSEYSARPSIGFDMRDSRPDPIYFSFESLPFGPCGHLATDIIDALAKGTVTGSLSGEGETITARFTLSLVRAQ
ncbi:MAG: hypothetical protein KAR44_04345 [Candidatus Aegiribacteria sp.]|nr:hypothetical protein [Candidatus Aegiribacteria sp.]